MQEIAYQTNASQRTPCMLVLDASGSMDEIIPGTNRTRMQELNNGLKLLQQELMADETARNRVQLAIVCVGGPAGDADLLMDWTDVNQFQAPELSPGGLTPLGRGMKLAIQYVEEQKNKLKNYGIAYTRPWIMVMTDGEPTDDASEWQDSTRACRAAEDAKRCVIYPIGVEDANMVTLQQLSSTPAAKMSAARFNEYFRWLSSSLSTMSRSRPGEAVQLPARDPWAYVNG